MPRAAVGQALVRMLGEVLVVMVRSFGHFDHLCRFWSLWRPGAPPANPSAAREHVLEREGHAISRPKQLAERDSAYRQEQQELQEQRQKEQRRESSGRTFRGRALEQQLGSQHSFWDDIIIWTLQNRRIQNATEGLANADASHSHRACLTQAVGDHSCRHMQSQGHHWTAGATSLGQ